MRLASKATLYVVFATASPLGSTPGYAQGNPTGMPHALNVNVTNTPLPVQGTMNGSVTITNQPNVFVTNGAANPVPTRDVNNSLRTPYMVRLRCDSANSNGCQATTTAIPAGKRLVLQHVNASMQISGQATPQSYILFLGGQENVHLPPRLVMNFSGLANYVINEPVLVFVDPGQTITASFSATAVNVTLSTILSGYLVDEN